jgi:predicted nucleic acid-binding protein
MIVVSDTSPLNYLILTGYVGVLHELYAQIVIPGKVFEELSSDGAPALVKAWCSGPPAWVNVRVPTKSDPGLKLTGGERAAVLLAEEIGADLILMDERTGRREAILRNLFVTGTLGILSAAAERGLVDGEEAIKRLSETSFRASPKLLRLMISRGLTRP